MSLPAQDQHQPTSRLQDVGAVVLPTPYGEFEARAFEVPTGHVYLALCRGDLSGDEPVLTRLHSECLTGDALGSLRCDCGVQLRTSLGAVAAAGRGVVLYLTGHEGRGIGLVNVMAGLAEGIEIYEASFAGLGGCPFAAGATGNICTEDLVYLLHEMGFETGIDLERLCGAARHVEQVIGRTLPGQVMKAGPRLQLHPIDEVQTAVG